MINQDGLQIVNLFVGCIGESVKRNYSYDVLDWVVNKELFCEGF